MYKYETCDYSLRIIIFGNCILMEKITGYQITRITGIILLRWLMLKQSLYFYPYIIFVAVKMFSLLPKTKKEEETIGKNLKITV